MVFPVVTYRCESWTIKKAEHQRTDAFKLWCWRRLLRVPWTARRSNQSILKESNSDYSLEGLMLKLKLQYYGHLIQRTDSLEKTLMLGNIQSRRRRGWQSMRWLDGIFNSMDLSLSKLRELVKHRKAWWATVHWVAKRATEQQQNMDANICKSVYIYMYIGAYKSTFIPHLWPLRTPKNDKWKNVNFEIYVHWV